MSQIIKKKIGLRGPYIFAWSAQISTCWTYDPTYSINLLTFLNWRLIVCMCFICSHRDICAWDECSCITDDGDAVVGGDVLSSEPLRFEYPVRWQFIYDLIQTTNSTLLEQPMEELLIDICFYTSSITRATYECLRFLWEWHVHGILRFLKVAALETSTGTERAFSLSSQWIYDKFSIICRMFTIF